MAKEDFTNNSVDMDSEVVETIIGADTKFKGSVKTDKPVRIDGYYEGDIDSTSTVIISQIGTFKGTVKCNTMLLDGHAEGNATCTELCKFAPIGVFTGDLATKNIVLVEGSLLDGSIKMLK